MKQKNTLSGISTYQFLASSIKIFLVAIYGFVCLIILADQIKYAIFVGNGNYTVDLQSQEVHVADDYWEDIIVVQQGSVTLEAHSREPFKIGFGGQVVDSQQLSDNYFYIGEIVVQSSETAQLIRNDESTITLTIVANGDSTLQLSFDDTVTFGVIASVLIGAALLLFSIVAIYDSFKSDKEGSLKNSTKEVVLYLFDHPHNESPFEA